MAENPITSSAQAPEAPGPRMLWKWPWFKVRSLSAGNWTSETKGPVAGFSKKRPEMPRKQESGWVHDPQTQGMDGNNDKSSKSRTRFPPGNSPVCPLAAVGACQVLIKGRGRNGSNMFKLYQIIGCHRFVLMPPHLCFPGSFLNILNIVNVAHVTSARFFPSQNRSGMPQRRCDFRGKLAATLQRCGRVYAMKNCHDFSQAEKRRSNKKCAQAIQAMLSSSQNTVWLMPKCCHAHCAASFMYIPVVPHKAVAEVSRIGNL